MSIPVWGGVSIGTVGQKLKRIIDAYPGDKSGLYVTSAFRSGDPGYHGGLSYGGSPGAAIDIGFGYGSSGYQTRARNFAAWLYQFSGNTVELIVSKVGSPHANGGYYVKNQNRVGPYAHTGGNTSVRHEDHVHFATTSALADRILAQIGGGSTSPPPGGSTPAPSEPSGPTQRDIAEMPYYDRPSVDVGDSGPAVGHLQFLLRSRLGYDIDRVSGSPFGPQTAAAVLDFKRKYDHISNGRTVVGSQTWAQLEAAAGRAVSVSNRPYLKRGDGSGWVGYLQHCLRKGGYTIDSVQGFPFGPQTENALKDAQRKHIAGASGTGRTGPSTWRMLDALENGTTPPDSPNKPAPPKPDPKPDPEPDPPSEPDDPGMPTPDVPQSEIAVTPWYQRPRFDVGSELKAVGHLKFLLRDRLGYEVGSGGTYDSKTSEAVLDFKTKYSHITNGRTAVGPQTWAQLEVAAAKAIPRGDRPELREGDSGGWVGYAQHCLRKAGYDVDDVQGFPFGPQTKAAVTAVQNEYRPSINRKGTVGSITWALLDALEAGKTPKKPGNGGGSSPSPAPAYNNTVRPIFGWDASDFDHDRGMRASHIRAAKNEGIVFFTHKATEHATNGIWRHNQCGPKLRAAVDAGIPFVGAYVVPRSGVAVSTQVNTLLSFMDNAFPEWKTNRGFFWQVDLEHWPYDKVPVSVGVAMCEELERRTNKKVILYAPRWSYGNSIPAPWNRVIWNSHYVNGTGNFRTLYPGSNHAGWNTMSGRRPIILQYSSTARIGGQHTTDANAYEGTALDFAKLIGAA